MPMTPAEQLRELGTQLASGGAASAFAKTCIAPFERTKILLQTSNLVTGVGGHKEYRGIVDVLTRIPREQGVTAFWRGNFTNISRVVPTYALRFTFFDHFRRLTSIGHDPSKPLPLSRQMAAGALSGSVTMLCTFPLDLLRTRMSAEVTQAGVPRKYGSMPAAAASIVRTQGPRGLYELQSKCQFSIEGHTFQGCFLHPFCIFNNKFQNNMAFRLQFAATSQPPPQPKFQGDS